MQFGSEFVFNYSDSEEEIVSDDEFEAGLTEEAYGYGKTQAPAPKSKSLSRRIKSALTGTSSSHVPGLGPSAPRPSGRAAVQKPAAKHSLPSVQAGLVREGDATEKERDKMNERDKSHHWEQPGSTEHHVAGHVKGRRYRRADTNVVSIRLGHLTSAGNMHTGDPVYCQCGAVLSSLSKLHNSGSDKVWRCEYCGQESVVDVMPEEIPVKDDITFMLMPAPTTTASGRLGIDQMLVIFCVDVSGSMCVTTEVPGRVKLRGDHLDRLQTLNTERENQYLPGQRRNTTYVSRLQGVQAAVDSQLSQMARDHPNRRVLLVTFSSEVTVVGDGSGIPIVYSGDKLKSWDEMKTAAAELDLPQAVKASHKTLANKLFDLEEGGQTALGPALLLSVSLASRVTGSKVIICTDGMANVGLGSLDNINNDEHFEDAAKFYEDVSQLATESGVSLSVTTIKGTDCKLMQLGQVAANTQGQVNIVDPLKLTEEFGNILADATIATSVEATLILHKRLYFRNEDNSSSKVTRPIGNVNKDTEITFEYGVRRRHKKAKKTTGLQTVEDEVEPMDTTPAPESHDAGPEATSLSDPVKDETTHPQHSDPQILAVTEQIALITEGPDLEEQPKTKVDQQASAGAPVKTPAGAPVKTPAGALARASAGAPAGVPVDDDLQTGAISAEASSVPDIDSLQALPFQVQIRYTDTDGGQAMRVLSQMKPVTKDRSEAEKKMNPVLLGVHTAQLSADRALQGEYTNSRLEVLSRGRLFARNRAVTEDVYDCYLDNIRPMENALLSHQRAERATKGHTYSDSSSDEEGDEGKVRPPSQSAPPQHTEGHGLLPKLLGSRTFKKKQVKASRVQEARDDEANLIYRLRQASSSSSAWHKKPSEDKKPRPT